MISESTTNEMIRVWRRARLSTGTEALGYPTENILEKARCGRSTGRPPIPHGVMSDPEKVQSVVSMMSLEIRAVFEAAHIMLIRGKRCREMPHTARALILGITPKTYKLRQHAGFRFCQENLVFNLDTMTDA